MNADSHTVAQRDRGTRVADDLAGEGGARGEEALHVFEDGRGLVLAHSEHQAHRALAAGDLVRHKTGGIRRERCSNTAFAGTSSGDRPQLANALDRYGTVAGDGGEQCRLLDGELECECGFEHGEPRRPCLRRTERGAEQIGAHQCAIDRHRGHSETSRCCCSRSSRRMS
jgi:hypothetical protein